jgi:hypothetical protein
MQKAISGTADRLLNKSTEPTAKVIRALPQYLKKSPGLNFGSLACNHPVSTVLRVSKATRGRERDLRKSSARVGLRNTTYIIPMLDRRAAPITRYMRVRGETRRLLLTSLGIALGFLALDSDWSRSSCSKSNVYGIGFFLSGIKNTRESQERR